MDQQQLTLPIRNAGLWSALRTYATAALELLRDDVSGGAELSFSVAEHRARKDDKPFYEYRPQTERFVRERLERIMELKAAQDAAWAVASDPACNAFLRAGRADAVADLEDVAREELLVPLLLSLTEQQPTFEFEEANLLGLYTRFEKVLYTDVRRYAAVVPMWGVRLVYGDLQLAEGVVLRQVDPELFRMEWPEAAQLNWGDGSRDGLPTAVLAFERAVNADDDDHVLDPLPAVGQAVSVIRALAGGSVAAGPFVFERLDVRTLAPRPVQAIAARPCGTNPSRIDGSVAKALPAALRRLSGDPAGALARTLDRWQAAATAPGLTGLRLTFDALVDIYASERETGSAALRLAMVVGSSLPERQQFVAAMQHADKVIRDGLLVDDAVRETTRLLSGALRATVAAALVGELPLNRLQSYADSVLLGERERKRLGAVATTGDGAD